MALAFREFGPESNPAPIPSFGRLFEELHPQPLPLPHNRPRRLPRRLMKNITPVAMTIAAAAMDCHSPFMEEVYGRLVEESKGGTYLVNQKRHNIRRRRHIEDLK
jgi:hypothetical protein